MAKRARELNPNLHQAQPYRPPDPKRVRHDVLWAKALARWRPGLRVWIETSD